MRGLAAILGVACMLGGATARAQALDTSAPTLTAPASADTYAAKLAVVYSLPDAPAHGTVKLTFSDGGDSYDLVLTDAQSGSFTLDTQDPLGSAHVVSASGVVPAGTYTVELAYQDAALDAAATATATDVTVGTGTDAVVTTAAAPLHSPYEIGYTLDDHCSSATLSIEGFSNTFNAIEAVAYLSGAAAAPGAHTFAGVTSADGTVDGSATGVDSWNGPVPDGPSYSVTVSCVNEAGDTVASPAVFVELRTSVVPPAILHPANFAQVGAGSAFTIEWLQLVPGNGSYQYVFTGPRNFTTTVKQRTTPATYPATISDEFVTGHAHPRFRMPNGEYTLVVRYFDPLVQLWASSSSVQFTIQASAPNAPIDTPPNRCPRPQRCG